MGGLEWYHGSESMCLMPDLHLPQTRCAWDVCANSPANLKLAEPQVGGAWGLGQVTRWVEGPCWYVQGHLCMWGACGMSA